MKESVLYLEVDEDITSAIDKLHKTAGPAVQIVVPKRSSMLQSIINLKLLKKAATEDGKELILVTNDRVATNLAAGVGLAVAPSLGSKAVMAAPHEAAPSVTEDIIEADDGVEPPAGAETEMSATAALAASAAAIKPKPSKLTFARKPVDDKPAPSAAEPTADAPAADTDGGAPREVPKGAITKIPSYNKLTRRLLWVGLVVAIIVGYFVAMALFTKAKATLYVIGQKVSIDSTFSADPTVATSDLNRGVLAAQQVTYSKDLSAPFTPTGQKDAGTKAAGTITVSNGLGTDQTLVAGTRFAAPDGKIFRSDADIIVPKAYLDGGGNIVKGTKSVTVTADQAGDSYNEAPATYTIPALSSPKVTAQGGQMSGGTTKTVTVVAQSDIDAAQAGALDKDKADSQRALDGQVPSGYMAVPSSTKQTVASSASTPAVGEEGSTATLALKVTYTQLAVRKSEFESFMALQEQKQVGETNQIYDNGLSSATITATGATTAVGAQSFHVSTTASAGAKVDSNAIAKSIAGKRYGDAVDTVTKLPGVQRADITVTPSWANSLPGSAKKITINIQIAGNK